MDPERIEKLLDRYFEGKSSLDEEATLRRYFRREAVPEALRPYRQLFRHFDLESSIELDDDFERQLLAQLENPAAGRYRRLWPRLSRIAAVLLLTLGIWWLFPPRQAPQQQASIDWSKYEPQTPEEAYRITRNALLKTSGELNIGAATAAKEMEKVKDLGRFFK